MPCDQGSWCRSRKPRIAPASSPKQSPSITKSFLWPNSRHAAAKCGSWASQSLHQTAQKSTRTYRPRKSCNENVPPSTRSIRNPGTGSPGSTTVPTDGECAAGPTVLGFSGGRTDALPYPTTTTHMSKPRPSVIHGTLIFTTGRLQVAFYSLLPNGRLYTAAFYAVCQRLANSPGGSRLTSPRMIHYNFYHVSGI